MGVEIEKVDIIRTKGRSFAYIDLSQHSADSLSKLFNTYNGCVWKGGRLRLEKAKEDYLVRLKREWDLDSQSANNTTANNIDVNLSNTEPADKLKKGILTSEKKQLRVFFPKLRKVKSLPFSGTGKHKYSFRRVEVPPLPTYFCDCEEHCGALYTVQEKQIACVEDERGGMNKREIELMNSVMHKLFEKETVPSATFNDLESNKEKDDTNEEINNLDFDEIENTDDDMIINVVSRAKETIRPCQDSKLNKRQASVVHKLFEKENISNTHNDLELTEEEDDFDEANDLQVDDTEDTDDDMIINVVSRANETIKPNQDSKSNQRQSSNERPTNPKPKKKTRYDEKNTESNEPTVTSGSKNTEPNEQFGSSFSWSQKSSWKELIGDKSNNSITISEILPSTSSKKTKSQKSKNSPNSKTKKSKMDSIEAQASKPDSPLENNEYPKDQLDEKDEDIEQAQPSNPESARDKQEYEIDKLGEKVEAFTEDRANKADPVSEKAGRGSAWLHKSSWTQLVTSNTSSSFSITQIIPGIAIHKQEPGKQIIPGIAIDKQEPEKPDVAVISNSRGDTIEKRESDSVFGASGLVNGSENDDYSARTAEKVSLTRNVADFKTFSFKRSDESLKEWAKLKAALTRSGKRTNKKK